MQQFLAGLVVGATVIGPAMFVAYHYAPKQEVAVRVVQGDVAHDQAAPLSDWITGNLAMGIAVTNGDAGSWPQVHTVGDYAVMKVDFKTGAVLAKCVP